MSYREIGREVGLHWTRVGQILRQTEQDETATVYSAFLFNRYFSDDLLHQNI
jgi:hypothetical protein